MRFEVVTVKNYTYEFRVIGEEQDTFVRMLRVDPGIELYIPKKIFIIIFGNRVSYFAHNGHVTRRIKLKRDLE